MKNWIAGLLLILAHPSFGNFIDKIPENLKKDAHHVILQQTLDFNIISERHSEKTEFHRIAVLKNDSHYRSHVVWYDKFTSVKDLKVIVYDIAGKKLETFKKKDFADYPSSSNELYSDNRYLQLDLSKFSTPFIVEIEQRLDNKDDLNVVSWVAQTYNESVLQSEVKMHYKKDQPYQYKLYNGAVEPVEHETEDTKSLIWTFKNLAATKSEYLGPSEINYFPFVEIRPVDFYFDGYHGSMKSWEDYNTFYYNLNKDRDELSLEMKEKIHQLTAELTDDVSKIEALYSYLKDHMRYVSVQLGIGGWQTFDAQYVEQNNFGDCKALSNFMGAMLKEADIDNHKVLIYRGVKGYREPVDDFVNTPFNHAMLYIPSEDMFLECTSNNYPAGYIGLDNANRKVMVSTEEGPIFKYTPSMGKDENQYLTTSNVHMDEEGKASIKSKSTLKYGAHDRLRFFYNRMTQEEREKSFQKSYPLPISELKSLQIDIQPDQPVLDMEYEVKVGKLASKAGKRVFIPIDPFLQSTYVPQSSEERKLPFRTYREETYEDQVTIHLPEGYEVESMPNSNYDKETIFGDLRMSIAIEEDKIQVYKRSVTKIFDLPAEKFEEYRNVMKEFSKQESAKIVLVKKRT